jgi:V/A-type H+/Na+-transporting ATPase subunit E
MGLEQVQEEIEQEAKKTAQRLIKEGQKEAERLKAEVEEKVGVYRKTMEDDVRNTLAEIERQTASNADLSAHSMVMGAKKAIIEEVFDNAQEQIRAKKQEAFLKTLLQKAKKELEIATVSVNAKDKAVMETLFSGTVNEEDIIGGIIAENKEQTIRIDYSFDSLLDQVKENNLSAIGKILFGK